ncbi:MAG TPA: cysteine desulfurase family protein [Candidatus Saccharimonadales bacterium]|nr:cysteine desulfurase family protein [Candidatus Saccharimonadales bacterium]
MRHVYLDHQAATPVLPEVFEAMRPFFTEAFGNPSSLHQHGVRARDAIAQARSQIAALINAESPDDIIFTSDGTESSNLAVKGAALASQRRGNHIVLSEIEHPSVIESVKYLEQHGFTATRVKVDHEGFIDPETVRGAVTEKTILIAIHHVNHDIGTVQAVREISEVAAEKGMAFYVDADASAGWSPVDVRDLRANLLSFSPHRFYGPKGVGVLYRNRRARLTSIIHGGTQENGWRAGIENVPAIVGAGMAAELARRDLGQRQSHCRRLQQHLWHGLKARIPFLKLNGPEPGARRSPTNLNISTEFVEGESQLLLCDMHGIALASGTNCISQSLQVSPVLSAIGLPPALAQGAILMSLGAENTLEEMDCVIETLAKIVGKLRGMSPTWDQFEKGTLNSVVEPRRSA